MDAFATKLAELLDESIAAPECAFVAGSDGSGPPVPGGKGKVGNGGAGFGVGKTDTVERVKSGVPVIGLYPRTNEDYARDFAEWRAEKGR